MKIKYIICGDAPMLVNELRDRLKRETAESGSPVFTKQVSLIISPLLNCDSVGRFDVTKRKTYFELTIDDDLNTEIEKKEL